MNGAREVDIILNFLAETSEARALNQQIQEITRNSEAAAGSAGRMGDYYSSEYARWRMEQSMLSNEARAMQREMSRGWIQNSAAYRQAREDSIYAQYGLYRLAAAGENYNGTTRQMMNQTYALGNALRRANDMMINNDLSLRRSFFQTAATMANMTSQAQRISDNYQRMRNPLLMVNMGHLALANGLNRVANSGNAANLALRMLGPTASTKQLNDMVMMINQGIMRMTFVAIGAAVSAYFLYSTMHKLAMENKAYASSLDTMKSALLKAFQPMIAVFTELMIGFFNFVTSVANMISAFNEAHPVLARFIQGMLLLLPALTLILSPLAIGIGLFGGLKAALFAAWAFIGPMITGLAAMTGTVWLVAGALIALYMYFFSTSKAADQFRAMVDGAIQTVIDKFNELVNTFPILQQLKDIVTDVFGGIVEAIKGAMSGDFSGLLSVFETLLPTIVAFLIGGIPGLIFTAARFLPAIAEGMGTGTGAINNFINSFFDNFIKLLETGVPLLLDIGVKVINGIVQGLVTALPIMLNAAIGIILALMEALQQFLPILLEAGLSILQALLEGIIVALPVLIEAAMLIINTLIETAITLLPLLMTLGMDLLMQLMNGLILALPMLIETIVTLVTMILETITGMLPQLAQMGITILINLINGLIAALPQLIGAVITIIGTFVGLIIQNLPQVFAAGIQILTQLIAGIASILGNLMTLAGQMAMDFINKVISYDFESIGINIIQGIINGIVSVGSNLLSVAGDIASKVGNKFKDFFGIASPSKLMKEYGGFITEGLSIGMVAEVPKVVQAAGYASNAVMGGFDNKVAESGYNVSNSRSNVTNAPQVTINVNGGAGGEETGGLQQSVEKALQEFFDYQTTMYES